MSFIWRDGRARREWNGIWQCDCGHCWDDEGWGGTPEPALLQMPLIFASIPTRQCLSCHREVSLSQLVYDWELDDPLQLFSHGFVYNHHTITHEEDLMEVAQRPYQLSTGYEPMPWGKGMWMITRSQDVHHLPVNRVALIDCPPRLWWPSGGAVCLDLDYGELLSERLAMDVEDIVATALIWRATLAEASSALIQKVQSDNQAQITALEQLWNA